MKLTFDREKFLAAFQMAASVAPTRSPKPILESVKLEATAELVTLMATDLEVGIRVIVSGLDVESPGSVILPVKHMGDILRESSDEKLVLESDGTKVMVHGSRSEFQLPTQNPDEFPLVSSFEEEKYHELSARFFREMVRRTVYATDNESSRYALGGVLIELSEDKIIGVGTDGRRLAKQEGPAQAVGGHETMQNTVIPTKAIQVMARVLADEDETIQLAALENTVIIKSQRSTVYTRLVEGRYPKWRDVFPEQEASGTIQVTVGPFHSAVRQSAIVTSDEHRGVDFTFGEGKIVMAGHGAELGESNIELPVAYDGPTVPVKLDPKYLSEFLKGLDAESTFTLHLRDADSAVICTTEDGYAYVIMPLSRE